MGRPKVERDDGGEYTLEELDEREDEGGRWMVLTVNEERPKFYLGMSHSV